MAQALHFDCFSGISGDMTVAALIDAGVPEQVLQDALSSLELPGKLVVRQVNKAGFAATQIEVQTPEEKSHRHLKHIREILRRGRLSEGALAIAERMFQRLAEAEAAAHGTSIEKVHFHEVGAVDSIFDFVATAVGIDWLGVDQISSSPVPTGSGQVHCDHGTLPVPTPAVVRLLTGIPLAPCTIQAELTTPTGAAIVATMATQFVAQPTMTIESVGYGAGQRELAEQPNLLRVFLGKTAEGPLDAAGVDFVWQVETNIDDLSPEVLGYCCERLFSAGALDVWTTAIQMKKSRPGTLLTVLCSDEVLAAVESTIFRETGTFGVRKQRLERSKLERCPAKVETPWGPVTGKVGTRNGMRVCTPEYEDCARVAREHGVPLRTVYEAVAGAFLAHKES